MDVSEAVAKRSSVRAFLPDPVPLETVRALVDGARQAPSGGNLQPWRVHALSGERLASFRKLINTWRARREPLDVFATFDGW